MKGLILKEFYVTLKSCKMYFIVDIIFIAMSFVLSGRINDSFIFLMYPMLISGVIPISLLNHDEKSKWVEYSGALPYSTAQMVSSKYLFGFVFEVFTTLITFLALVIYVNTIGGAVLSEVGLMFGGMFIISLIIPTISLPFCFKFGTERGRMVYFVLIFIMAFVLMNSSDKFSAIAENTYIIWIIIAAIAALYVLSWFISVSLYGKREITS